MNKKIILAALLCFSFSDIALAADDHDGDSHGPWQFRLRAIGVLPDGGGNTTIGGDPNPDNAVVPEFDISYFLPPILRQN